MAEKGQKRGEQNTGSEGHDQALQRFGRRRQPRFLHPGRRHIASIIGPNGAGKTTFFNCITGFYQIDDGEILFDGARINGRPPDQITRAGISRTFQNIRLFNNMSAIENVMVGQEPHLKSTWIGAILGLPFTREEDVMSEDRASELLQFVGLAGKGDMLSKNLSYGDQRRLEIARAPGQQAQAGPAGRADGRHESAGNHRNDRFHPPAAR